MHWDGGMKRLKEPTKKGGLVGLVEDHGTWGRGDITGDDSGDDVIWLVGVADGSGKIKPPVRQEGITSWTIPTLRCQMLPRKILLEPLLLAKILGFFIPGFELGTTCICDSVDDDVTWRHLKKTQKTLV